MFPFIVTETIPLLIPVEGVILEIVGVDTAAEPVAVNVTEDPSIAAVSVFDPVVEPRVHVPALALPSDPVVAELTPTVPPPDATANVTVTPLTMLFESLSFVTMTVGDMLTAVPTVANWLSPALLVIVSAATGAAMNATAKRITKYISADVFFIPRHPDR